MLTVLVRRLNYERATCGLIVIISITCTARRRNDARYQDEKRNVEGREFPSFYFLSSKNYQLEDWKNLKISLSCFEQVEHCVNSFNSFDSDKGRSFCGKNFLPLRLLRVSSFSLFILTEKLLVTNRSLNIGRCASLQFYAMQFACIYGAPYEMHLWKMRNS